MTKTLNMLYHAFAHPYFSYSNHVWGNTCLTSLDIISKLQNKLGRIIYNSQYDANTEIIYKKLKIMKFININKFQIAATCTNTIMASYQIMLMKCS